MPKPNLNPGWIKAVKDRFNPSPYFDLLSMRIVDIEPGRSCIKITAARKHLHALGIVHGGVLASLVDTACGWAVYTEIAPGLELTTVEMKLNYLAPAVDGDHLIGLGKCLKHGKTLSLAEARVEDAAGRLLAHGTVTFMALVLPDQQGMPPKYL